MSSADPIHNPLAGIEQLLLKVPGAATPVGRVAIFGGAGAAYAYNMRPSISFHADGSPRPWILMDSNNAEATLFPYWAWFVVPGAIFGVFI